MNQYPAKLTKYLNTLDAEERHAKEHLYSHAYEQALEHEFQSARFWAMRQVVSGLTLAQIEQKIRLRMQKKR